MVTPRSPPRPASPPISVFDRPPVLSGHQRSSSTTPVPTRTSSHDSGQSLSSVLSTPSDSTTRTNAPSRAARAPPSAYLRRHSAQPSALFFDGAEDSRLEFLNTLRAFESEWELIDGGAALPSEPEPKQKLGSRRTKQLAAMMAEPMRPAPQQKKSGGFMRRLTQSRRDEPPKSPPVSQAPPQIPRLSTFLADQDRPLLAQVTSGGSATPPPTGSFMSTPPRRSSSSSGPAPQLPPGAAPATSPVTSPIWQQNATSSSFAVAGRPERRDAKPVQAPLPMPNGNADGIQTRGPRALPNGTPMSPPGNGAAQNGMPQPFGRSPMPPSFDQRSPPPASQHFSPQPSPQPPSRVQQTESRPSPVAALASPPVSPLDPRWVPTDPRGGFPTQVYSRPPLLDVDGNGQAHAQTQRNVPASVGKPLPTPQWTQPGHPQPQPQFGQSPQQQQQQRPPHHRQQSTGYAPPPQHQRQQSTGYGVQPGQIVQMPGQASQQLNHALPSLPNGAMALPSFSQNGPPPGARAPDNRAFSPNGHPNGGPNRAFSPTGPVNGGPNVRPPYGPVSPPPMVQGGRPLPGPPGPPGPPAHAAQQQPFSPNGPLPNLPPGSYAPGVAPQRRVSNPPRFAPQQHRPAPLPPGAGPQQTDVNTAPHPARTTSVRRPSGGVVSSRPMPSGSTAAASGTTMQVIASSDNRGTPSPAVNSRPRIAIPVPSTQPTSPPPQPQPYTAPVLAAATAATTPIDAKPRQGAVQPVKPSRPPIDVNIRPSTEVSPPVDPRASDSSDGARSARGPADQHPASTASKGAASQVYANLGNGHPSTTVPASSLPPRTRSTTAAARRIASSPLASPVFSTGSSAARGVESPHTRAVSEASRAVKTPSPGDSVSDPSSSPGKTSRAEKRVSVMNRPRPKPRNDKTFSFLLTHPRIVNSLLPFLNINSFLNVLGSDEELRKYISGEMVGRWVMREWGISVDRERGRSWPGLTVWEGFLESLLHDPAVYSTYPDQYFNLLRHLSLSHSLIVLFLRTLPASAFPYAPPLPFEDDLQLPPLHKSSSVGSFHSLGGHPRRPGSRATSHAGSDNGSTAGGLGKMPRRERVAELVMPAPLSAGPQDAPKLPSKLSMGSLAKTRRRGSIGSLASVGGTSLGFGRKRSNSTTSIANSAFLAPTSSSVPASPVPQGKAGLPPVSFPAAKRYQFARHNGGSSKDTPNGHSSSRPGSIMSAQSSAVGHGGSTMGHHASISRGLASSMSADHLPVPPPIGGGRRGARSSMGSNSSSYRSERGGSSSPVPTRWASPTNGIRNNEIEPAFDRPPPYMTGRAPILRVFVPVSEKVPRWPSAEGAAAAWRELEKCGANKRMRMGDLVVNTALARPVNTEHVLVFVPFVQHKLVPLEYVHSATGHLPHYLDAFALSPVFYDPFLPTPQIVYLDFAPYAQVAMNSLRLAYDWHEVTTASGARLSSKRYLHVAGFEIKSGDRVAPEWHGMISLEAEGTAEGKRDMLERFGYGNPSKAVMGAWEVVRERSMMGSLWLRLVREPSQDQR